MQKITMVKLMFFSRKKNENVQNSILATPFHFNIYEGEVSSSCSTFDTRILTLLTNPVISHE
jgi:hypothetical protein